MLGFTLLLLFILKSQSQELNTTIYAFKDSYVIENGNCASNCQTSNFGTAPNLYVRGNMNTGNSISYLSFSLAGLEYFQSVNNFTLRMYSVSFHYFLISNNSRVILHMPIPKACAAEHSFPFM